MIECTTCGAQGEANFSTNYFGELVCELCGTQSFLQSRNETQDMEDTNLDVTRASTMKRATRRSARAGSSRGAGGGDASADSKNLTRRGTGRRMKRRGDSATLLDCLRASQAVLRHQALALAALGGFPDAFAGAVEQIWFQFLETWERKSARPLLRCFTEFFLPRSSADKAMDPALTQQLLEQWGVDRSAEADEAVNSQVDGDDAPAAADDDGGDVADEENQEEEEEKQDEENGGRRRRRRRARQPERKRAKRGPSTRAKKLLHLKHHSAALDQFSVVDLLGMLVLAARALNLGVLPCDVAHWVSTGELPFHNLLSVCAPELQAAVYDVSLFFESTIAGNRVTAARVAYHAHYLQHHLELPLPPLNVSLAAHTMCANLGFPPQVFRHFQWLTGVFNAKGAMPEPPLLRRRRLESGDEDADEQLIASSVGVAAHLAVAVKLTANWHEWIYERPPLRRARLEPPYRIADARLMLRRELDAFVDFCEDALVGHDRANVPSGFESHVYDLRGKYSERSQQQQASSTLEDDNAEHPTRHPLLAYPALHVGGVCDEQDDEIDARVASIKRSMTESAAKPSTAGYGEREGGDDDAGDVFFYPLYARNSKFPVLHAAYEHVLELLCAYIDAPIVTVLAVAERLDREVHAACKKLEATTVLRQRRHRDEKAHSAA